MLRWFDHFLRGIDNGAERDPTVRYDVMGPVGDPQAPGNEWRTADDWPVPAQDTAYYLHSGDAHDGRLDLRPPTADEPATTWLADPLQPATIPGTAFPGA